MKLENYVFDTLGVYPSINYNSLDECQRFSEGKANKKPIWLYLHQSHSGKLCAVFGTWKDQSQTFRWYQDGEASFTTEDKRDFAIRAEKAKEQQEAQYRESAERAQDEWDSYPEISNHTYLARKGVGDTGLTFRQNSFGNLVVPCYSSENGTIIIKSLQRILPDGNKFFLNASSTKGVFYPVGCAPEELKDVKGQVYIAEGLATALSIYKATSAITVVAFNCGNLTNVCKTLLALGLHKSQLLIVADNDTNGAGLEGAGKAKKETGVSFVLTPLVNGNSTDANDYAVALGHDKLQKFLETTTPVKDEKLFINLADLEFTACRWLVKKWIARNTITMIHGQPGSGKTFIALDMLLSISSGIEWHGYKTNQANVLYLCGEGFNGICARVKAWLLAHDMDVKDAGNFALSKTSFSLIEKEADIIDKIKDEISFTPDIICVDTLNRFFDGEENSAKEMGAFITALQNLARAFNAAIFIVHHEGVAPEAQGRARGSSALRGAVDAEFSCVNNNSILKLTQKKQKDINLLEPLVLKLRGIDIGEKDEDGEAITSAYVDEASDEDIELATVTDQAPPTEERATLCSAWLENKSHDTDGGFIISQSQLRDYLRSHGYDQNQTKNFLRTTGKYKGVASLLQAGKLELKTTLGTENIYKITAPEMTLEIGGKLRNLESVNNEDY